MTNKEVINFLNQVRKILLDDKSWLESTIQPINEAFDMAINALTAQPEKTHDKRTEMHACDCVFRQDAIDAVHKAGITEYDETLAIEEIERVPPAEPERKNGEWEEIEVIADAYDINGVKTWASKMKCNQCGFTTIAIEGRFSQYNFCPNCGADMRGTPDDQP